MNTREKYLAIAVAVIVGGYALLTWVIDPVMASFEGVDQEAAEIESDLKAARALIDNEKKLRKQWKEYELAGLNRATEVADGDMASVLLNWAYQSGLDFSETSLGPRTRQEDPDDERFVRVMRTFVASGTIREIEAMLWSIKTSPLPLRIEKCSVDKRRDEGDALDLVLMVSTLVLVDPGAEGNG